MTLTDADYPRIALRVSPEEYARIKAAAHRDHLPIATWIRRLVLIHLDAVR